MNVIANKAKRLGNKINRKVQSRIDDVSRLQGKKKSLRKLRESNVRSDLMLLPSAGEQMLFRVTRKMNLSDVRKDSQAIISQVLEEEGMLYWELPTKANAPATIHTLEDNGRRLLTVLRGIPELSHWYFQFVREDGKSAGAPRLLREIKWSNRYRAIRLYERVAYSPTSNFRAGATQGVVLNFWVDSQIPLNVEVNSETSDDETPLVFEEVIVAPVWNENATLLPNPVSRDAEFRSSLEKARNPLATQVDFEIDAVYTWVDGADDIWQAQKASALHVLDEEQFIDDAVSDARFADHDELKYSLRSIDQFAPWIRKIWIVSAGQVPAWLDTTNPE
nr:Stealth CR1 domain-containing protein [Glutamicibacter sp. M10]